MASGVQHVRTIGEQSMTFDSPTAEKSLRITSRLMHQGMWLLLPIAAALAIIVRHDAPDRTAYLLGCGVLAFMLSYALWGVRRKLGYRDTQDKLVRDVKTFLEKQPADLAPSAASPAFVAVPPSGSADFVPLQGAAAFRRPAGDPVVFDAFPSREGVAVRMDFRALVLSAESSC
jgi:hypothetical protein